jgi:cation diffusion facilitator CzcD-associated flavoprotein CzcO
LQIANSVDALVIGAGPAGLATSRELSARGVSHLVLERGDRVGHTWSNLYDSLVLHTARRLSTLPGMPYPRGTPLFPPRHAFVTYLERYADRFRVPLETNADVETVRRAGDGWIARTSRGAEFSSRALVVATGIVANPYVAAIRDRERFSGRVIHSVEYRRPDGFTGQRVLVVGAGNSAGEIATELARAGASVTLAVRTGARIVPREIAGIPIQYLALVAATLPRSAQAVITDLIARASALARGPAPIPPPPPSSCPHIPLIGLHLADALRAGAIRLARGIDAFTDRGVRFDDHSEAPFDAVILATGYKAALQMLEKSVRLDACGFARRVDRVVSADDPTLYFVGHTYDLRGAIFNICRDAPRAAEGITRSIAGRSRTSTETQPRSNGR